ncbi:MAG: MFS transporter [Alphaproteobacteria bacterium]
MAFFRNSTVNLLNLHYGIHQIAMTGGGAFVASYLLKSGVSIPGVFLFIAGMMMTRFIIRPLLIGIGMRIGLRALVAAGAIAGGLALLFVPEVHGIGLALFAFFSVSAIAETVYWPSYHAYFAALGDAEHRGHQLGAREALSAAVGIVSPLATGWVLVALGPRWAFYATAVFAVLSVVPLLWMRDVEVKRRAPGTLKMAKLGIAIFVCDGWVAAGYVIVWQIALFTSLNENFLSFGGALAIAALAGAIASLFLGRHIDLGHGGRAVWYAFGSLAFVTALRALAIGDAPLAVASNALGAIVSCLYMPTVMTAVYNEAKRSPCPLRFHVAADGGWDIGGASGLAIAALLTWLGVSLGVSIVLSFAGIAVNFILLRRYYASSGVAVDTAAPDLAPGGETGSVL